MHLNHVDLFVTASGAAVAHASALTGASGSQCSDLQYDPWSSQTSLVLRSSMRWNFLSTVIN